MKIFAMLLLLSCTARLIAADGSECPSLRLRLDGTNHRVKQTKARAFLWRHWSEKKCGELFLTTWSREGVRTDSHYKIGPVQNAMLLTVSLSRADDPSAQVNGLAVPASGGVEKTAPENTSYLAYSVERVKSAAPYDAATAKVIKGTESLPPSKYRLRFKDKDGKVITDF